MGVPVAAYDIPGIDQLVEHNETGMLATLGDKETLKTCWDQLLWDNGLADRISQAAADKVNEKFSAARMAVEYSALYRKLLTEEGVTQAAA